MYAPRSAFNPVAGNEVTTLRRHTQRTSLRLGGLLMALALGCCGKPAGPFVTVLLSNFPPETKSVTLKVSLNGVERTERFTGNDKLSLVTIEFPAGTRGTASFSAQTLTDKDCLLGSGTSDLAIDDDKAFDVGMPIIAEPLSHCGLNGVKLTLRKMGTAQGTVSSTPAGVMCDSSCTEQVVEFRQGSQVMLSAQLSGDDELAGWSDGCTGSLPSCTFTMDGDKTVVVTINRCQGFCPLPSTGTSADLYAVWGSSPSSVYAVGAGGAIVKFDGTSFSPMTSGTTNTLRAISAPRDNTSRVLAAGDAGTLLELSGTTWKPFATAAPNFQITGVAANTAGNIYIAGASGNYRKLEGTSWNTPGTYNNNKNLTGISFMPGNEEHFMSGAGGLLVRYNPGELIFKYPGQNTNTSANLSGVWAGSTAIYLIGDNGTIVKRNAGNSQDGQVMQSGTSANLRSVYGANNQTIFVVGDGGTALKGDGTAWVKVPTRTTRTLYSVFAVDSSNIFVVGEAGTALRFKP